MWLDKFELPLMNSNQNLQAIDAHFKDFSSKFENMMNQISFGRISMMFLRDSFNSFHGIYKNSNNTD